MAKLQPVLLVEDDPDDIEFVRRAFRKVNILNPLDLRPTIHAAQQYLSQRSNRPAAVIVDIYLPNEASGLDLLKWLRAESEALADTPVIVLTVSTDRTHYKQASALGVTGFLQKPVTEDVLLDTFRAAGLLVSRMVKGRESGFVLEPRDFRAGTNGT